MLSSEPREAMQLIVSRNLQEFLDSDLWVRFNGLRQNDSNCHAYYCMRCGYQLALHISQERSDTVLRIQQLTAFKAVLVRIAHEYRIEEVWFDSLHRLADEQISKLRLVKLVLSLYAEQLYA